MLEKTSTVTALVKLLTERIHSGEYEPGTKLPSERKLQEEFGVGRLALREALSRLNALGIIETSHGRGTFVQNTLKSGTIKNILIPYFALNNSARLKEFVDARTMIVSEIAGLAALQRNDDDLHRLEAIVSQDVNDGTPPELVTYIDLQFHQELALIIDNRFLALMHDAITAHLRSFLNAFVKNKNPVEVLNAHRPILEAIRRGNVGEAQNLVRRHISFSRQDYEDFVSRNER